MGIEVQSMFCAGARASLSGVGERRSLLGDTAADHERNARFRAAVAFVSARPQAATPKAIHRRRLLLDPGNVRIMANPTSRSHPQPERGAARISVASTR
jgi:hypothetical protein